MASSKLSAITNQIVGPAATDRFYIVEGIGGTPAEGYITFQDLQRQALGSRLFNGLITTSVASNNLTVAIKTAAGTDPSSDNPVTALIGGSYYQITAALSITLNAGTNYWGGNGDGYAKYYFVYLSYNSGVILGIGQMPYFTASTNYNNTSSTATYLARSTGTPGDVENIGMFKATLGTGPSYNWSIDSTAVYQGPCYTTPTMAWLGTPSGVTLGTGGTSEAYYHISDKYQHFRYFATLGSSGYYVDASTMSLPIARSGYPSGCVVTVGRATYYASSGGLIRFGGLTLSSTTLTLRVLKRAGDLDMQWAALAPTAPFTWANGDKIALEGSVFLGG